MMWAKKEGERNGNLCWKNNAKSDILCNFFLLEFHLEKHCKTTVSSHFYAIGGHQMLL